MTESSQKTKQTVLAIGVEDNTFELVVQVCGKQDMILKASMEDFIENFESYNDGMFDFVICGPKLGKEGDPIEVGQIIRNQCPRTPILFATENREYFAPKSLIKNGFSTCYLIPVDAEPLRNKMADTLKSDAKKKRSYRSVRLLDVEADTVVDFDTYVFLPLNKKHVKFCAADQNFSQKKVEKLKQREIGALYVEQKDLHKFYEYTANHLKDINYGAGPMSETEREEKLQEAIRNLFGEMFDKSIKSDYDSGKEMVNTCQKIVSNYITNGGSDNWYNQLISAVGGQKGGYNHAASVSTFAALFAIGVKHPHPEELAMAGFLHDLALADFPDELLNKPMKEWTEDQRNQYLKHPEKTVNMIKERKMIVSPGVESAILQHHEMFTGKGFPNGLKAHKISQEAQILSFADQFDYLTSEQEGKKRYTPYEAVEYIAVNGSINPELVNKIRRMIPKETTHQGEENKAS